jgi:aspartate/methionine/tyrosine aminotransferase
VISQYAAIAALQIAPEIIAANKRAYQLRKECMETYLKEMTPWLSYYEPTGGYFIFPKLLHGISATNFCYDLLKHARVIAIPGKDFGDSDDNHIRLCFGRSVTDIHEGMSRIKEYMYATYPI